MIHSNPSNGDDMMAKQIRMILPIEGASEQERLVELARYIEANASKPLPLERLAKRAGLSSTTLQKRFKRSFGVSPKAYQDAARLATFKKSLKAGEGIAESIFEAGFGSTSRVYGESLRNIGMTPSAYRSGGAGERIHHACRVTALGPLLMAATDRGVCFAQFGESESELIERLQAEFPEAEIVPSNARDSLELDLWIEALDEHLSRSGPRPDLPLDLRGTAFQIKVWRALLSIPEGEVRSYGELAAGIQDPKAVRAAASACGANRIAVLVPCHRVLRGDGGLGGYRWGVDRKRTLLDAERAARANRR
jgi:AraC family transcriptional regulator of adaptative response/methylated-DNA-[protein]-cysteine methyltransferase